MNTLTKARHLLGLNEKYKVKGRNTSQIYLYKKKRRKEPRKIAGQRTDKLSPQILSVFPKDQAIGIRELNGWPGQMYLTFLIKHNE